MTLQIVRQRHPEIVVEVKGVVEIELIPELQGLRITIEFNGKKLKYFEEDLISVKVA